MTSQAHLGHAALVEERLHLRQVFHVKEPAPTHLKPKILSFWVGGCLRSIYGRRNICSEITFSEASYLEFCIHSTGWMDILQICIAPILDPLPLWPLQDFTSFTISANLRGTYIAAGSSKSKCQTFFAFLPKQVTFWRQSQTWSWELSLFKISELIAKQYSHSQLLLNHQWVAIKKHFSTIIQF